MFSSASVVKMPYGAIACTQESMAPGHASVLSIVSFSLTAFSQLLSFVPLLELGQHAVQRGDAEDDNQITGDITRAQMETRVDQQRILQFFLRDGDRLKHTVD